MLRLANVATPFTALTGALPDSVPLDGFVPIATVILPVNEVAVFPAASYAVTLTAGVIAAPACALLGWTVNASRVPAPGEIVNGVLTVLRDAPVPWTVRPPPALPTTKSLTVATP